MTKEHVVISFNNFKETCENYQKICELEEITDQNTFENFYRNRVYYGFPVNREKFKLVKLPGSDLWHPIDSGLADVIVYLNEKGYTTKYCCSGHKPDFEGGYIYFASLDPEKIDAILNLAFGWMMSDQMYVRAEVNDRNEVTIRFRPISRYDKSQERMLWAIKQSTFDFIK